MAEEEGKQEMTEEIQSQGQEDDELELETDFFGLNDINKDDNMKVKAFFRSTMLILNVSTNYAGFESWNRF